MAGKLTPKKAQFVQEYLIDLNATRAYLRCGYKCSESVARRNASRLLTNADIQAAIAVAQQERAKRTQIDSDWVLQRLAAQADADMADLFNADGALKPPAEWPDVWRKGLVAGIEVFEEYAGRGEERVHIGWTKKVKLADRMKNLELIGRHVEVGAFRDKVEHTGKNGGPIPIAAVQCTPEQFKAIAAAMVREV